MNTDIKTLMQMTIGQIKDLEAAQKKVYNEIGDIIDRQKETVAAVIEQEEIMEEWAEEFIEDL